MRKISIKCMRLKDVNMRKRGGDFEKIEGRGRKEESKVIWERGRESRTRKGKKKRDRNRKNQRGTRWWQGEEDNDEEGEGVEKKERRYGKVKKNTMMEGIDMKEEKWTHR